MVGWTILEAVSPKKWKLLDWIGAVGKTTYVARGDMLLKEICFQRKHVAGGDMLPKEICCQRKYVAKGDAMSKRVSSKRRYLAQRRYLAKGGIQPKEKPISEYRRP